MTPRLMLAAALLAWGMLATRAAHSQQTPEEIDPTQLFAAGFDLFQAGRYPAAATVFRVGLQAEPRDGLAHFYLAESIVNGRADDSDRVLRIALFHYTKAIRYLPGGEERTRAVSRVADIFEKVQAEESRMRAAEGLERRPPTRFAGDVYDGEWKGTMPNGRGIIRRDNGERYEGDVKDGKPDGYGTLVKIASLVTPNDTQMRYEGEWKDGVFEGEGVLTIRNPTAPGVQFLKSGFFVKGNIVRGTIYTGDGRWWEGEFHDDVLHGEGTEILADGKRRTGRWRNGEFVRP
jgi:hypothetical protein